MVEESPDGESPDNEEPDEEFLKFFEVYEFTPKTRLGPNQDAGYVICELEGDYDCYISSAKIEYARGEAGFDTEFLSTYNIEQKDAFAFDGTIENHPVIDLPLTFINKNISTVNDENNTDLHFLIGDYDNIFLSMDIEGDEYPWIASLSDEQLKKFKQICIEFHGVTDNEWGALFSDKKICFERLHQTHYIMHVHGNNHSGSTNSIPDVLEVTYIRKDNLSEEPPRNTQPFPMELDCKNNPDLDFDHKLDTPPWIMSEFL